MKKACSCLFMIVGAFAGLFGGVLIFAILDDVGFGTDIGSLAFIASIVFFTWIGSKTGNYIGDKIENRIGKSSASRKVELSYMNGTVQRIASVDASTARKHGNLVKVALWNNAGTLKLAYDRIKNPEVLGMGDTPVPSAPVIASKDCPNCSIGYVRPWAGEKRCWHCGYVLRADTPELLPPVLTSPQPMPPTISAEPVVVLLQYLIRRGQEREIRVVAKAYMDANSMIHCNLADSNGTLVLKREQILNSSVLILRDISEMPTKEEEPPVLEPKVLELGDSSGRELIYTQNSGELAVIYFDPATVEKVGNLVNLSPMGIDERYAIAMGKIINPEALEDEPKLEAEEMPPVLSTPKQTLPEVIEPQLPEGTRVLIRRVPTDSYEAVQVMRRLMPRLSTFEIFEVLEQKRLTALTGYNHDEAIRVGGELEAIGCTVDIKRDEN